MPLGRQADCSLGHIHAMRCACLASALQHGLNTPYVHALAAAGVQERHLSRDDVYDVPYAGRGAHKSYGRMEFPHPMCHAICQGAVAWPKHSLLCTCLATAHSQHPAASANSG